MQLKYLPSLDGIRACAFSLVFVAHSGMGSVVPGGLGVTIFFFLSGYLITTLLRVEWANTRTISLSNFYTRRALRILPPLYLVLAIGWLLDRSGILTRQATGFGFLSVFFYFYNYAVLIHPSQLDIVPSGLNVVWSLMIEEHFYLLFPFIFLFMKKSFFSTKKTVITLSAVCLGALLWRCILVYYFHTSLTSPFPWNYAATDARFDSILWGCILAIGFNPWCGDTNLYLDRHRGRLASVGILMIMLSLVWREPHFRETLRYTIQGVAMLPIFYYVVSAPEGRQIRWLSWRPVRWLGWVSYTMYLVHLMVLHIVHKYAPWSSWLYGVWALVISGLFAELVRRTVEIPLRRLKRKKRLEVAVNN